ncbi:MAG: hypothetical protein SFV18_14080 [Bryobacteraceae bacterium]|nr:hypothetical protein [Bryobacteraceae bacterium]
MTLAIVRVREDNYVPDGAKVRARIDETMFTAAIDDDKLDEIRADPKVQSVEVSRRLQRID